MSTPTIIRHAVVAGGFYVVVTYTDVMGFNAAAQHYSVSESGDPLLQDVSVWSTEQAAIDVFDKVLEIAKS